jgi:hypothetical protein
MKKTNLFYIASIIILLASIYIIIERQDSQRFQLLAGAGVMIGLGCNIAAYGMKKE